MRILLFCPTMTVRGSDTTTPGATPPLGLASVAAYLETKGHDVKIIDAIAEGLNIVKRTKNSIRVGLSTPDIFAKIAYYNPDIVGISSMFTVYAPDAHEIAKLVKKFNQKIPVVFGGAHTSILSENVLKDKNVDLAVIGEGEETMLEIVTLHQNNASLKNILGTAVRDSMGKYHKNKLRPFIPDINTLPPPARHLLPMDIYLNASRDISHSYTYRSPSTTVITSRGCPGNCIYCAVPGIWGRTWRPYTAQRIYDEIEYLKTRYGVREIQFLDDNISVNPKRLDEICNLLIENNLDIKWTTPNGIAIWTLNKQLLIKMQKSGCYRLTFGIETGHPETQKFIRKYLDLDKAAKIIKTASDLGIWIFSTYIIGFPYETKESIKTTFDYAIKSYSDFVVFILLMPFPNTDVTNIMVKEGILKKSQLNLNKIGQLFSGYQGMGNKLLNANELRHMRNLADKKLMVNRLSWPLTRPVTILKKIKTYEDLQYIGRIFKNFITMFLSTIKFGELKTHRLNAAKRYHILQKSSL